MLQQLWLVFLLLHLLPSISTTLESFLVVSAFSTTAKSTTTRKLHLPFLTELSSSDDTAITTNVDLGEESSIPRKGILYDTPVSNHGARCRIILYKKNISANDVLIQSPSVLGGLTSDTYRICNPEGKMPLFVCTTNVDTESKDHNHDLQYIFESDTISRYLLHEYEHILPSFQVNNVRSNMIVRIHDMYISTIQGCLYKVKPPFGIYGTRYDALQELIRQLHIIEDLMVASNNDAKHEPYYLCGGDEVSLADATIYPTMVFVSYMLPKFDLEVPTKLLHWYEQITRYDPVFAKVQQEILSTLRDVWDITNHRWDPIFGAGWRDTEPSTIFDQIMAGTIPATIVEQPDDQILAIRDINPAAPTHILLIPKQRYGLTKLSKATLEHTEILGRLLVAAAIISRNEFGPNNGSRIVINDGPDGGQDVMHLHVHILGGRSMSWPPG